VGALASTYRRFKSSRLEPFTVTLTKTHQMLEDENKALQSQWARVYTVHYYHYI